jgi:hypothetical protein
MSSLVGRTQGLALPITLPSGLQQNDVIWVFMATDATISTPTGWTLSNSWLVSGSNAYLFKCVRGASNPSLAFIATSSTFRYWTCTSLLRFTEISPRFTDCTNEFSRNQ